MEFFKSNFISSKCYFMPKELHPNRQYAFTTMILICHSLECRDLKEEVFLSGWITYLWRRIFPLRLRILVLTHLQAEKVSSVLPENLMAFLTLGNNLKVEFFSQGISCLFSFLLITSMVLPVSSFMVVSWTSPKPSLLHVCLLGPPWPQFLQVCPLGIFRACHGCDLCFCFLSGFLSAFPIP